MNTPFRHLWITALALIAVVSISFAATSDYFLKITDADGKEIVCKVKSDGTFTTPPLAPGVYSFSWGVSNSAATHPGSSTGSGRLSSTPARISTNMTVGKVCITYEVSAPRDAATGQASGKRMHKPMTITKDWSNTAEMCTFQKITIDNADCVVTGSIAFETKEGKPMAWDDWTTSSSK